MLKVLNKLKMEKSISNIIVVSQKAFLFMLKVHYSPEIKWKMHKIQRQSNRTWDLQQMGLYANSKATVYTSS